MTNATKSLIVVALMTVALLATVTAPLVARPAAATVTTWAKTYGGPANATGSSVQPTADGGYVVLGETRPAGGNWDLWALKLDAMGAIEWQYLYGGVGRDRPEKILQTSDGGYIILAMTYSFGPGGPTSAGPSSLNAWILKLDALGGVQWQKAYGGAGSDLLRDIQPTSDGGYIVAGYSTSHRPGVAYDQAVDAWVMKLDSAGNVVWQKAYGGDKTHECASSIQQTSDGGYIVAGSVAVWGLPSAWLFKLNNVGTLSWQKIYGTGGGGYLCAEQLRENPKVLKTPDGGYLVNLIYLYGEEQDDGWVVKVDSAGKVQWRKSYGTPDDQSYGTPDGVEHFFSADVTSDGGYVLAGHMYDGVNYVAWVVRVNSAGNVQWQKMYGIRTNGGSFVHQTPDGGFILVGTWPQGLGVMKLEGNGNPGVCTDPAIGADSSAVVKSSTIRPSGNQAKAVAPSTSVTNTGVTPTATIATVSTQCTS